MGKNLVALFLHRRLLSHASGLQKSYLRASIFAAEESRASDHRANKPFIVFHDKTSRFTASAAIAKNSAGSWIPWHTTGLITRNGSLDEAPANKYGGDCCYFGRFGVYASFD